MTIISSLTLENEMDLVLAYKKTILVAEACKHTVATQTTFATAVSEIARELIERSNTGTLTFNLLNQEGKYKLVAQLKFDKTVGFSRTTSGYLYASKLVADAQFEELEKICVITLQLRIPSSSGLNATGVKMLQEHFKKLPPLTPYEEVKNRNQELYLQAISKEENLQHSLYINERKDEFIAMAGHELKTPLTLVKAYSQVASFLNKEELATQGPDLIQKIDKQVNKMQVLIQQLLDISHISNGSVAYKKEDVSFCKFMNELHDMMLHLLPEHKLTLAMDAALDCYVHIDRIRMEQVLTNLSGNAAKYSNPGTNITIACKLEDAGVKVMVSDEGIGISEKDLGLIFDKFYRVSDIVQTHSGLGMGLFITSNILKAHDSSLMVESQYGKGTTFYFTLPLAS